MGQQAKKLDEPASQNNTCCHQLFERQAEKTPNAIALDIFDYNNSSSLSVSPMLTSQSTLSYHELNIQANSVSSILTTMGVGPEVLVGIFVDEGPRMVVAQLAVWKAGGAFVPCDLHYPAH